jgi:small conductance mechanosensitive channel
MDNFHLNPEKMVELVIAYLPRLALAIVTLIVGLWLIRMFVKGIGRFMESRKVDESLRPFLQSIASIVLKVLLLVSVMGMIGIEMTSFIAVLGALGLSIGMALSGALQHFAGGVLILIYKPFKKGDFIEAQGQKGNVKEIRIFNTILSTIDNKTVFIPNGPLSTGTIVNFSAEEKRRIDMVISISYSDDMDKARLILQKLVDSGPGILKDPAPLIAVSELGTNSVDLAVRVWVNSKDFQDVNFAFLEAVKKEFDKEKITIPPSQMHIHVKRES